MKCRYGHVAGITLPLIREILYFQGFMSVTDAAVATGDGAGAFPAPNVAAAR
ncbi:hypothetical protein [Pontibacter mucosus]|uniref:hypothetical protein n=1 Tax=Pontibacter mucosus TaxID=1649266 RepID=UPI001474BE2B|nr:hypothetical protein [Pontibacter mucosus]